MRIAITGGRGPVRAALAATLDARGHQVTQAPSLSRADAFPLYRALTGARVLIDLAEAPSRASDADLATFLAASRLVVAASVRAGIRHHVALSAVGAGRISAGWYFPAFAAQELEIRRSSLRYTLLRASLRFDAVEKLLASAGPDAVRLPPVLVRPVSTDDIAEMLAEIAVAPPSNATLELAGAEVISLNELARQVLVAQQDPRPVIADASAPLFGATLEPLSLLPDRDARVGSGTVRDWLSRFIFSD